MYSENALGSRNSCDPALFLETGAAQHRAALRRLEGNRRLHSALRTDRTGFGPHPLHPTGALRLALLTVLGVVFELFVVEKDLLAGRKHKLGAAVAALQYSIGKFHGQATPNREEHRRIGHGPERDVPVTVPCSVRW